MNPTRTAALGGLVAVALAGGAIVLGTVGGHEPGVVVDAGNADEIACSPHLGRNGRAAYELCLEHARRIRRQGTADAGI